MDRRQFLKISGAVAATAAVSPSVEAAPKKSYSPLEAKGGYVKEPARQIPVVDSTDVIVLGGGPAGFTAAVSAAREGASVMLIEREYFLGGLFTGCGVTPIINMFNAAPGGRVQAVYGIAEELCARIRAVGLIGMDKPKEVRDRVDPEAAKYFMEEICKEARVRILYGVHASQVITSGDEIKTVFLEGKSGRVAINCRFVVDCTGDGDVLAWTNEDFNVYKDNIGAMWRIGNVPDNLKRGTWTPSKGVKGRHTVGEKDQDGLDMYNLTRVQLLLRERMWKEAQQYRAEGAPDLFLLDTPSVVGVRVTRVLNSVANVTVEGAATGKSYKDVIGFAGGESNLKYSGGKILYHDRKMWQVPYSSLTPKTISNLLVAGRCFGYERGITYDAREVGTCLMTGQAAGTAAALALASRVSNRDVDITRLQSNLRRQNVKLDW